MNEAIFRRIAGMFATGVVVVTTSVAGTLHGITVNSLTTVSLAPLLLLVCIDKSARAHEQIEIAGRFAVSFLADDQEGLSRLFAARGAPEAGRLRGAAFAAGAHGMPILAGCLAYFECEVTGRFEGGDHTIFVASVLGGAVERDVPPLLFYQGRYGPVSRPPPGDGTPPC